MRALLCALAALATACHAPEERPLPPNTMRGLEVGCLDVAIEVAPEAAGKQPGVPLAVNFVNRCAGPVLVDLRRLKVTATATGGRELPLTPYDPDHAIHPGRLAPNHFGGELLELDPAGGSLDDWTRICADFARVVLNDRSPHGPPACVDRAPRPPDGGAPRADGRDERWPGSPLQNESEP